MNLPQLPYCRGCGYVLLTSFSRCALALASGGAFVFHVCTNLHTYTDTSVYTHTHTSLLDYR